MIKLCNSIKKGIRIRIPEEWHEKIVAFCNQSICPYEFEIEDIVKDKTTKETFYICKAEKKNCKNNRIILTEYVVKYLLSEEVTDSNVGLSFKEFLPMENSKILITYVRNPSEVIPAIIEVLPSSTAIKGVSYVTLDFVVNFLNGKGFTALRYFCNGNKKSTWKLMLNRDQSYMTDYEKMFCDTFEHKGYVMASCEKLAKYLDNKGAVEHAKMLRERAKVHDNSKITCEDEMHALSSIINDKESLRDSSKQLSQTKMDAIKLHWKHNTHHPEHFKTPIDMSKLDIMEMCCDWHARSMQYGTDLLEFVKKRQEDRFHFPAWMFAEIWHYCEVLAQKDE